MIFIDWFCKFFFLTGRLTFVIPIPCGPFSWFAVAYYFTQLASMSTIFKGHFTAAVHFTCSAVQRFKFVHVLTAQVVLLAF